jgi:L-galactonate dehydratase
MSADFPVHVQDVTITSFKVIDLRFPTSLDGVGSDAMHVGTNGSHPYIQLKTNKGTLIGEGIVSSKLTSRWNSGPKTISS